LVGLAAVHFTKKSHHTQWSCKLITTSTCTVTFLQQQQECLVATPTILSALASVILDCTVSFDWCRSQAAPGVLSVYQTCVKFSSTKDFLAAPKTEDLKFFKVVEKTSAVRFSVTAS